MRPNQHVVLTAIALLFAGKAAAAEVVGLAGLQSGPIGGGPAFAELTRLEAEGVASWEQTDGIETRAGQRGEASSSVRSLGIGLGLGVDKDFSFSGEAVARGLRSASPQLGTRAGSRIDGSVVALSGGPALWLGSLIVAGRATLLSYGRETQSVASAAGVVDSVTDAVAFPVLTLFAGWRGDALVLVGHAKLYNDATTTARTAGADASVKRRSPARLGADARLAVSERMRLAGAIEAVGAERAGRADDDSPAAKTADYGTIALGGSYQAAPWLAVAGSYRYTEPAFADAASADAARSMLGGSRLELGLQYRSLGLSTQLGARYTVAPAVDTPADAGPDHTEETSWSVTAGATLHW